MAYPFATIALTEAEFQKLRAAYPDLDYPSDFRWVDQALKEKLGYRELAREVRLRSFSEALANRVTVVLALRKKALEWPASKDRASVDHDAAAQKNCWFDDAGRLQVANGFRIDLLKLVSGNEDKLRLVLDEIGPYVPIDFRPVDRLRKVRSSVTRQLRFHEYDLSRHAGKTPATPPTRVRNSREDDPLREDPHWWQRRCSEAFGKDNKGWNATRLGPPPGEPGSFVPPAVQRLYNHEAHETTIAYWKLRVADPKQEDPLLYGVVLIIDCREILKRIGQPATPSGNTPPRSASASSRGS